MEREGYNVDSLMKGLKKTDYQVLKCARFAISSTYIREHLEDEQMVKTWLPEGVIDIIRD